LQRGSTTLQTSTAGYPLIRVKAFDCFQQPDSSFLYQIGERAAVAPIPPGDPDEEAELA
jgi:hypothetical protein